MREVIQISGSDLYYLRYGTGPQPVLCFHGYSNAATLFAPLQPLLGAGFTVYSIELPHHGSSTWRAGVLLSAGLLADAALQISRRHNGRKISLAAFSLGGRAALCLLGELPHLIRKAALVAPDGLGYQPAYRLLTRTAAGRYVFAHFTKKPGRYLTVLDWLHQKKWIDASRYQFASWFVHSREARQFLKNVWLDLRTLMPRLRCVKQNIRQHKIPVLLIMGRHDRIIPLAPALRFAGGLNTVKVEITDNGHRLMDSNTFGRIAAMLKAD